MRKNRAWLAAHHEYELSVAELQELEGALQRLELGEPLPYVLGAWEFFGLEYEVTPAVLIPRPETELLVERALAWLRQNPSHCRVADVGTGSGCIAVTLAVKIRELQILATDVSPEALQVARRNAAKHGVEEQISFSLADLLPVGSGPFDLICANLPYIPTDKLHVLQVYGREPTVALDGGPDGLSLIRRLLVQAKYRIKPDGLLLFEIEETTGQAARDAAKAAFPEGRVDVLLDLAGRDRLLEIQT